MIPPDEDPPAWIAAAAKQLVDDARTGRPFDADFLTTHWWDAWLKAWDDVGRYAADCMLNPDDFIGPESADGE